MIINIDLQYTPIVITIIHFPPHFFMHQVCISATAKTSTVAMVVRTFEVIYRRGLYGSLAGSAYGSGRGVFCADAKEASAAITRKRHRDDLEEVQDVIWVNLAVRRNGTIFEESDADRSTGRRTWLLSCRPAVRNR